MGHDLIVRKDAAVVGVVAQVLTLLFLVVLLVLAPTRPGPAQVAAAVLWRWLVVRKRRFCTPVCFTLTAGLCCLALGSVAGGFGMACGLWLEGALPFGKPPWRLWLEQSGQLEALKREAQALHPKTSRNRRPGLTPEQK